MQILPVRIGLVIGRYYGKYYGTRTKDKWSSGPHVFCQFE